MTTRLTPAEGAVLVALARAAIEDRLLGGGALAAVRKTAGLSPALLAKRACFVTLKTPDANGELQLRGCIGTTEARRPAHESAVEEALAAAFEDPRFEPLAEDELPGLVVSVSALTPHVPVSGAGDIVLGRDGVALECDGHRALFLPEVAAEQGWNVTELLEQLARKADLPAASWRRAKLFTFESERFGENEDRAARIRRS
jgi:AmmeMemoRadiSam system protein A